MPSTCRCLQCGRGLRVLRFRRSGSAGTSVGSRDHKSSLIGRHHRTVRMTPLRCLSGESHCPNEGCNIKGPPMRPISPQHQGCFGCFLSDFLQRLSSSPSSFSSNNKSVVPDLHSGNSLDRHLRVGSLEMSCTSSKKANPSHGMSGLRPTARPSSIHPCSTYASLLPLLLSP